MKPWLVSGPMAALLAACASVPAEPIVRTVEVKVPVAVPCVREIPAAPASRVAETRAQASYTRAEAAAAIAADLEDQRAHSTALRSILAACQGSPQ